VSTRTGNFMRKSVIITGFLIDDEVAAVNDVDGDYYYYYYYYYW
jgi:hypothetical protein